MAARLALHKFLLWPISANFRQATASWLRVHPRATTLPNQANLTSRGLYAPQMQVATCAGHDHLRWWASGASRRCGTPICLQVLLPSSRLGKSGCVWSVWRRGIPLSQCRITAQYLPSSMWRRRTLNLPVPAQVDAGKVFCKSWADKRTTALPVRVAGRSCTQPRQQPWKCRSCIASLPV